MENDVFCRSSSVEYAPSLKNTLVNLTEPSQGMSGNQTINFCETPCHFGGTRQWFVCPECSQKAYKLRFLRRLFMCGKCIGLGYESQRINRARRLQNRAAKIKGELGIDKPASLVRFVKDSDRPRGMHWLTFRTKKILANGYTIKAIELW